MIVDDNKDATHMLSMLLDAAGHEALIEHNHHTFLLNIDAADSVSASLISQRKKSGLAALTVAAVRIVYGDIGTSPLYTMKEVFSEKHGLVLKTPIY
jgi:hypothetical protein